MDFSSITSLEDLIKTAQVEVLLAGIAVTSKTGATVIPVRCPAVGRKEDYGKTQDGKPACVYNGTVCPYFLEAEFKLDEYTKRIECSAV